MNGRNSTLTKSVARRIRVHPEALSELDSWDHVLLVREAEGLFRTITWFAGVFIGVGAIYLGHVRSEFCLPFLVIALAGWAGLILWMCKGRLGIPVFPVLIAQQTFFYSFPLLFQNPSLEGQTVGVIRAAAWTMVLFLAVLSVGWWLGVRTVKTAPSRWNFCIGDQRSARQRVLTLALLFLSFAIAFHLAGISGVLFKWLPSSASGVFSVIRTFAGAAAAMGAFLGGVVTAGRPANSGKVLFWVLVVSNFSLSISDLLISAASGLVISCAIGLGLGLRRIPWRFLMVAGLIVAFLNQGKFVLRERYWDRDSNTTNVGLTGLPMLYREWVKESFVMLRSGAKNPEQSTEVAPDSGQSLFERVNNLQNLTFVVDALHRGDVEPLYGKTYAIIPGLLVPRILWPDKPRTHQGQVMLNLTFGRQATVEDTFRTFVAWGLLPEAVGNFGLVGGACFLGLIAGLGCGFLEVRSARKRLFSVEGVMAGALLIQIAISYEMVASVFVTATFQLLVAVVVGGFLIRFWFPDVTRPRQLQQSPNQPQRPNQRRSMRSPLRRPMSETDAEWKDVS